MYYTCHESLLLFLPLTIEELYARRCTENLCEQDERSRWVRVVESRGTAQSLVISVFSNNTASLVEYSRIYVCLIQLSSGRGNRFEVSQAVGQVLGGWYCAGMKAAQAAERAASEMLSTAER